MKQIFAICVFVSSSLLASAQTSPKAQVFPASDLRSQLDSNLEKAKATGGVGLTLGDFGSHTLMLSERTASGGAEVHGHFDDVMIVLEGEATLTTGGVLLDPKSGDNGEMKGSGIRDGVSSTLHVGDLVHVPAGTPHQLTVQPGTKYSAIVVKVKE